MNSPTLNSTFDPKLHLMNRDITFMPRNSPQCKLVHLKVSKTDPFRQGQTIVTGKTNSPLFPISAMVAYLNSRPLSSASGPLFTHVSGGLLTREKLIRETRLLISKGGSGLKGICWAQFPDRCSYDSCLSKLTPMAH